MSGNRERVLTLADAGMNRALRSLWAEAFGDDEDYMEFYFKNRFVPRQTAVCVISSAPVSMAAFLPVTLHMPGECGRCNGRRVPARYVYAVATRKEYRGRGLASALIKFAQESLREPFLLQPADEGLFSFYRRLGFREAFYVEEYMILPKAEEGLPKPQTGMEEIAAARLEIEPISPLQYKCLRDKSFAREGYVEWGKDGIAYALLENRFCGGHAYKVSHDDKEDILLLRPQKDSIFVMETTLSDREVRAALQRLGVRAGAVKLRRPVGSKILKGAKTVTASMEVYDKRAENRAIGMLYLENGAEWENVPGYLNLTLE